jgi:hypothetical protein
MKKLFIVLLVLVAFTAKSQIVDSTFTKMTACKIFPFKAKWNDTTNVDHLGVRIISDDLKSIATLYWALMDSNGVVHYDSNDFIRGTDYTSWNGNNSFPFTFIADKNNIVFIKPE